MDFEPVVAYSPFSGRGHPVVLVGQHVGFMRLTSGVLRFYGSSDDSTLLAEPLPSGKHRVTAYYRRRGRCEDLCTVVVWFSERTPSEWRFPGTRTIERDLKSSEYDHALKSCTLYHCGQLIAYDEDARSVGEGVIVDKVIREMWRHSPQPVQVGAILPSEDTWTYLCFSHADSGEAVPMIGLDDEGSVVCLSLGIEDSIELTPKVVEVPKPPRRWWQ